MFAELRVSLKTLYILGVLRGWLAEYAGGAHWAVLCRLAALSIVPLGWGAEVISGEICGGSPDSALGVLEE